MNENNTWGILCPGPSLALYETHKQIYRDDPDILTAVNGAILFGLVFDYWAVIDIEVFNYCMRPEHHQLDNLFRDTTLLVPQRWNEDITDKSFLYPSYAKFNKEFFPGNSNEEFASFMPFGKDIQWRERTMFVAIALAALKGAKNIYLYGADMGGNGYYRQGLENYRTRHNEKRWQEERFWLDRIIKTFAENDITLLRR